MVVLADTVLSNLLNFVGVGYYVYIGGVSRQWRSLYSKISKDKDGNLITKYSNATASVPMLEYAVACGVDLGEDPFKFGSGGFGPGVYEWARENGFPLLVWVVMDIYYDEEDGQTSVVGSISGVYSSVEVAKDIAAEAAREYLDPSQDGKLEWEMLSVQERLMQVSDFAQLKVKAFAVEDVDHATEIELEGRLPMYVVRRTEHGEVEDFEVDGVYNTKEAANRKKNEGIARARALGALTDSESHDEGSSVSVYMSDGRTTYEGTEVRGLAGSTEVGVESGLYLNGVETSAVGPCFYSMS